ncbi:MAG: ABC transporter ATP-binding protein [Myxococcota bacterium]
MSEPARDARPPLVELRGVTRIYGAGQTAVAALAGIDLRIERGEFLAVMGPSGSGKSTCMNLIGCLDTPSSGSYRFAGVEVGALSRDQRARLRREYVGFVFQGFHLLGRSSALENTELPLVYRGLPAAERRELAKRALASVGLTGWESHTPAELSGGQQQRVAIARAIVTNPLLLLADEPTGNLDSERGREILELLARLNRERGITVVIVTHDEALARATRRAIHFVDGRIVGEDAPSGSPDHDHTREAA